MPGRQPELTPRQGLGSLGPIKSPSQERTNPYEEVFDNALADLDKKGIHLTFEPPKDGLLTMPSDPVQLGPGVFAYYENALRHWEHVASVEAELNSRLLPLAASLGHIKARLKKQGVEPSELEADEEYIQCNRQILRMKVQLDQLEPLKSSLHKRMQLLSRLVEGIKLDQALGGRAGNLGKRRPDHSSHDPW